MYKVGELEFETFEAVIKWAYNTYKLDISYIPETEAQKHEACDYLSDMITEGHV